jgi:hypothetical protein
MSYILKNAMDLGKIDGTLDCTITIANANCKEAALQFLNYWDAKILNVGNESTPIITCQLSDRNALYATRENVNLGSQLWFVQLNEIDASTKKESISFNLMNLGTQPWFLNDVDACTKKEYLGINNLCLDFLSEPLTCAITISNADCKTDAKNYLKGLNAEILDVIDYPDPKIICKLRDKNVIYSATKGTSLREQKWYVNMVEL